MKRIQTLPIFIAGCLGVACLGILSACDRTSGSPVPNALPLSSGFAPDELDPTIRPQDNLYDYVNARWLAANDFPTDKAQYGAYLVLRDETFDNLHATVKSLSSDGSGETETRKIADLYRSVMDEETTEKLGIAPLRADFARIDAIASKGDVAEMIGYFNRIGITVPLDTDVHPDAGNSTQYALDVSQGGLSMPDPDYYLNGDDEQLKQIRGQYPRHIKRMFGLLGEKQVSAAARDIIVLETRIAQVQWTRVDNRDPLKIYNPYAVTELDKAFPGFDWMRYLKGTHALGKVARIIVNQPSYARALGKIMAETPLLAWKRYLKWRLLTPYAQHLSTPFVDENFAFFGSLVSGIPENRARWKRAMLLVDDALGEALGKLFVAQNYSAAKQQRMDALVRNLLAAYRQSIDTLDWMGPETRKEALAKLTTIRAKIGYPKKWRDYSALKIDKTDLVGNVMRAEIFDFERKLAKLGEPVDRDEWGITPHTVDAYYTPELNDIVFPAAILQPPFFDDKADDAVNYGGVGAVIGHEISHAFDDVGSQFDENGNLRNWWSDADRARFKAKAQALVEQYAGYSPVPGYHINGELTLGENIADLSGLAIAYKAYRISLGGKPSAVIDGLSGEQRLFLGWARVWREKVREVEQIRLLKIEPHSPTRYRAIGALVNQAGFYEAFRVGPTDKLYLAPGKRIEIW